MRELLIEKAAGPISRSRALVEGGAGRPIVTTCWHLSGAARDARRRPPGRHVHRGWEHYLQRNIVELDLAKGSCRSREPRRFNQVAEPAAQCRARQRRHSGAYPDADPRRRAHTLGRTAMGRISAKLRGRSSSHSSQRNTWAGDAGLSIAPGPPGGGDSARPRHRCHGGGGGQARSRLRVGWPAGTPPAWAADRPGLRFRVVSGHRRPGAHRPARSSSGRSTYRALSSAGAPRLKSGHLRRLWRQPSAHRSTSALRRAAGRQEWRHCLRARCVSAARACAALRHRRRYLALATADSPVPVLTKPFT